jgi:hypothetical protein
MNHEDTKNTKEEGRGKREEKNLFTRQLVLDRLLVVIEERKTETLPSITQLIRV